ncbi:unnamed protein product, partial [marine sediment metagenome]
GIIIQNIAVNLFIPKASAAIICPDLIDSIPPLIYSE